MKTLILILSLLLLTSCSNPDTSGGVTLSRGGGGDWDNTFPNGSCKGPDQFDNQGSKTGCGWISNKDVSPAPMYYISPNSILAGQNLLGLNLSNANLNSANLSNTNLSYANLNNANLSNTILTGVNLTNANLSGVNLNGVNLSGVNLTGANLSNAILTDADLRGVRADSRTICPNGKKWKTAGNNCGF